MEGISVHEKNVFIAATDYYKSSNYTHFLIIVDLELCHIINVISIVLTTFF